MNETVPVTYRDQKTFGAAERPLSIAGTEAGEPLKLLSAGAEEGGEKPPPLFRFRHAAVLVLLDAFL